MKTHSKLILATSIIISLTSMYFAVTKAKLYDNDLKAIYQPNTEKEDQLIEHILKKDQQKKGSGKTHFAN